VKRATIILLLFLSGCDLLTTRDPEPPDNRPSNYLTPSTTDILLNNFSQSFKDGYVEFYIECLVDPTFLSKKFRFIPSASALQSYPVFNDWTTEGEKQYFNKLRSVIKDNSTVTLSLSNQVFSPQGDSATVSADYHLFFNSKDTNFPSDYQGFLLFKLFLDKRNQWVIVEWQDIKKENYNSWSELKGRLY